MQWCRRMRALSCDDDLSRGVVQEQHDCDGNGACVASADKDCTPFRCDPAATACYTTCSSNAQCVQKHPCVNNACIMSQ
jgi:hypothetical protein